MKKYVGTEKKNTAVFISGKGSNLKNLILFSKKKNSPIKINLVVASTKGASGIKYAKKFGIKNLIYSPNSNLNKDNEFQYEELRFLLKLIAESNFQGTDIQVLYNIVLKLQNKMKIFIEEND